MCSRRKLRTKPAPRLGCKIGMTATSLCGRNWQARRIEGSALAPTRASTKASRPEGRGSTPRSLTTRTRQVEQRARPPQTLACGTPVAQARLQHAHALRHPHLPMRIGHGEHAAAALVQAAYPACSEDHAEEAAVDDGKVEQRNVVDRFAHRRHDRRHQVLLAPQRIFSGRKHLASALDGAEHRQQRHQHRDGEEDRPRPPEQRFQPQPEKQPDAGVRPGDGQQDGLDPLHVWPRRAR